MSTSLMKGSIAFAVLSLLLAPIGAGRASADASVLQFTSAGCSASPSSPSAGDTVTLTYNVHNNSIVTVTFGLGATITRLDTGQAINDPANDVNVTIGPGQTGVFTRVFHIPALAPHGVYNVTVALRIVGGDGSWGGTYDSCDTVLFASAPLLGVRSAINLTPKGAGGFFGPAQQGITALGDRFFTSNGTSNVFTKGPSEIFEFDLDWQMYQSHNPISPLQHLGDITAGSDYLYGPMSDSPNPGTLHIQRFTLGLEEAGYWDVSDLLSVMGPGGDLAGLALSGDTLYAIEYQENGDAHIFLYNVNGDVLTQLGSYIIETRWANGIEIVGSYAYITAGAGSPFMGIPSPWTFDGVTYGEIHVYDLDALSNAIVNKPIAVYAYDVGAGAGGFDAHAEGLAFKGTELWVCASHGRQVRWLETPMLPDRNAASADMIFTVQMMNNNLGGPTVAGAGDVDGDGFADLIVGARGNNAGGENAGRAYVYSGATGANLYTFTGEASSDWFGNSVAGAGDVNGDGFADLIVGAPANDAGGSWAGRAYVYSGATGANLYTFTGQAPENFFGISVAGAGDVNGDGYADLIVGAFKGGTYVYSGATGATLHTITDGGEFVDGAGDVDGDGFDDLIVGSLEHASVYSGATGANLYTFTGGGISAAGAGDVNADGFPDLIVGSLGHAYVYSGATGAILHTFTGEAPGYYFGHSVAGAGDVNGDGFDDLIVGAGDNNAGGAYAGRAYVYSGATGAILYTFTGQAPGDGFGFSVAGAGDVNGDGFPDVIVGTYGGRAYVFYSPALGTFQPPTIASMTAAPDPIIQGDTLTLACFGVFDPEADNGMPAVVEFYRDANGDGFLQPAGDELLGVDSDWTNGWVLLTSTGSFPPGVNTFFARARSTAAATLWSEPVSTTANVVGVPTIASLSASPDPLTRGDPLTLAALGVADPSAPNGMPALVEFYRDANGTGALEPQSDTLVAVDSSGADGWSAPSVATDSFPLGLNMFFARALSSVLPDLWSTPVSDTVTIEAPCANADLSGDGVVNGVDLAILLTVWGTDGGASGADLNGDGVVNGADLATLLSSWGACP